MGSSLRRKKKHKASGSTVQVGKVKKSTQQVKVLPVLLPGATDQTNWRGRATPPPPPAVTDRRRGVPRFMKPRNHRVIDSNRRRLPHRRSSPPYRPRPRLMLVAAALTWVV
jgi:hypothetical protein